MYSLLSIQASLMTVYIKCSSNIHLEMLLALIQVFNVLYILPWKLSPRITVPPACLSHKLQT